MKTAQRHLAAIRAGEITKTNVIGIRKALNALDRPSRTSLKVSFEDLDEIISELHRIKPRVTGELHDSGLKLLRSPRYRKRLELVSSIIENLDHFELVDFEDISGGRNGHYVPIYRAVAKDGSCFEYRNVPWQSGGNGPELI